MNRFIALLLLAISANFSDVFFVGLYTSYESNKPYNDHVQFFLAEIFWDRE